MPPNSQYKLDTVVVLNSTMTTSTGKSNSMSDGDDGKPNDSIKQWDMSGEISTNECNNDVDDVALGVHDFPRGSDNQGNENIIGLTTQVKDKHVEGDGEGCFFHATADTNPGELNVINNNKGSPIGSNIPIHTPTASPMPEQPLRRRASNERTRRIELKGQNFVDSVNTVVS